MVAKKKKAPCTSASCTCARCLSLGFARGLCLRWSSIIAVAAQRAFASLLLELPLNTVASAAGEPAVHDVLQDDHWLHAAASSRLPARA